VQSSPIVIGPRLSIDDSAISNDGVIPASASWRSLRASLVTPIRSRDASSAASTEDRAAVTQRWYFVMLISVTNHPRFVAERSIPGVPSGNVTSGSRVLVIATAALLLAACRGADAPPGGSGPDRPSPPAPSGVVAVAPSPQATGSGDVAVPSEPGRTRFAGRIVAPLPEAVRRAMRGRTWEPGCPVPLEDLALLRFNHVGFDGEVKRGPMVVHVSVAEDVLGVFRTLFRTGFPIRHVALSKEFHPNADPDTRRSVTASFNCRPIVTPAGPGDRFSMHAYGLAVDVNPLQNPYVAEDGFTRNRYARPYRDRSQDLPGMIHEGDVVVRAFAAIGWEWGGRWSSGRDYMHFSANAR
jgi:hypothetical protein